VQVIGTFTDPSQDRDKQARSHAVETVDRYLDAEDLAITDLSSWNTPSCLVSTFPTNVYQQHTHFAPGRLLLFEESFNISIPGGHVPTSGYSDKWPVPPHQITCVIGVCVDGRPYLHLTSLRKSTMRGFPSGIPDNPGQPT
jgi:hypothetical protein